MYRFKTKKEFEEEYGSYWYHKVEAGWTASGSMDYLFGKEITKQQWNSIQSSKSFNAYWFGHTRNHNWSISKDMVTDSSIKLNKSINYVNEKDSNTEVCNSYSQGKPTGTTIGIHSKPISIARGSRFVGSEATNLW